MDVSRLFYLKEAFIVCNTAAMYCTPTETVYEYWSVQRDCRTESGAGLIGSLPHWECCPNLQRCLAVRAFLDISVSARQGVHAFAFPFLYQKKLCVVCVVFKARVALARLALSALSTVELTARGGLVLEQVLTRNGFVTIRTGTTRE